MPGIYSARYGSLYGFDNSSSNNRKVLLEKMKNENNRNAHFECTLVYYDGDKIISSNGIMKGQIAYEEVGTKGFGYDPIFFIPEYNQTVGELDEGIKNKLSHRYNAIINFISKLKDNKN